MSIQFGLFIVALILLLIIYMRFLYLRLPLYKLSWKLPGPVAFPLVGNGLTYLCPKEDILDRTIAFVTKYPSPVRFWFGPKFTLIFKDPDQVAKIVSSTNFLNKDEIYKFLKVVDGESLITGGGQKWKRDRKLMSSLFLKTNISQYLNCIEEHVQEFLNVLKPKIDQPAFNVEHLMHRCVADFINETILGTKTNAQSGELDTFINSIDTYWKHTIQAWFTAIRNLKMYELIHERIVKVWLQVEWIFNRTHYAKVQENAVGNIDSYFRKNLRLIEQKRKEGQLTHSVMDEILDIRDQNPDWADEDELVYHLTTFYSAGEDTVTTISSFSLLLFGMHQEIQTRVYNEIVDVVGDADHISIEDFANMPYLDLCLRDVLRLYPIGPYLMRVSAEEFQIDDLTIPKGCTVIFATYNLHRDPQHWEKPEEFYPEHFLPEAVEKRHPYAYIPFSAGPRGCIGKSYANMALKILLTTILRRYQIFAEGTIRDVRLKSDISVRTRNKKYPISIKLRK